MLEVNSRCISRSDSSFVASPELRTPPFLERPLRRLLHLRKPASNATAALWHGVDDELLVVRRREHRIKPTEKFDDNGVMMRMHQKKIDGAGRKKRNAG